jgi:dihydrofolate reductase
MRRIIAFEHMSADGYFTSRDGKLDWTVPDEEVERMGVGGAGAADMILFGRRTYEMFESFWPKVVTDAPTAPDPHAEGRATAETRAMGEWINAATKWVFSRTRKEVSWNNSHLRREIEAREIEALKRGPGKDIMIFGSGSVVSRLTELGLVDAYDLLVAPVLLGRGRPLIDGVSTSHRLKLAEARPFRSGNALLHYERS